MSEWFGKGIERPDVVRGKFIPVYCFPVPLIREDVKKEIIVEYHLPTCRGDEAVPCRD